MTCEHGGRERPCARPAAWIIVVGEDRQFLACDEHRNETLMEHEAKDVSGIYPVGEANG